MSEVLKILLVDDNEDDRALVARELSRNFFDCEFQHVIDGRQLASALQSGTWDLIVSDYQLRWSNGLSVLAAVKARLPDCPVIMFTGSGSEEIAVQAMKAGLDDYVLKSPRHSARLVAAAHMALQHSRQRKALLEAERRYQILFDGAPVGLFRVDREGTILNANLALVEMLGYPDRENLLTIKATNIFAEATERHALLSALRNTGIVRLFEVQALRRDGTVIWADVSARMIWNDSGDLAFYEGSLSDITARKQAERAVQESEARKGAILNSALDAVVTFNHQAQIMEFNPAAEKMFGRLRDEVLGKDLAGLLIPQALWEKYRRGLERHAATGQSTLLGKRYELTALRADGKEFPIELAVTQVDLDGPPVFTGFIRDITERKRAEQRFRDSREQFRALAAHLQSVREEERSRIAREVHDELGQALTSLKMDLAWLDKRNAESRDANDLARLRDKLKELPGQVDAIINTVRQIAIELRPPILDALGLEAAIEWQTQDFEKRTGIACTFRSSLKQTGLDPERATAVFRIFQETLTNIVRHAAATQVNIQLREEGETVVLEVQDNGRGMSRRGLSGSGSLGLLGMRERATMLDGEVNIIGRQGRGTTVGVRIPIHGHSERSER
jgi:PAS domain S-box-containing protein